MRLPRRRQRFIALGAVVLVGLGVAVAVTRPSGGKSAVDVQAAGGSDLREISDPLPEFGPSSSSTTVTTPKPKPTTTSTATTSTMGSRSCAPAAPVYAFGLHRRPDGNGWAAGANPALQRSTDGGRTWTPACLPASAVTGNGALYGIDFATDGQHAWVVGGSGGRPVAFRTVDGGDHWLAGRLPDDIAGQLTDIGFADPRHGWAVGNLTGTGPANAAGGVLLTTGDGGATWTTRAVPGGIARLSRISIPDATHGWAVGASAEGRPVVIATNDGGATWSGQLLPDGIRELRDIAFVDQQRGWAVGARPVPQPAETGKDDPGVILTTTDGGASWTEQAETVGSLWSIDVVDPLTAFAGGGYGLFSTTDGGTTWTKQPFTLPALDAVSFTDATHGWVTHSMFSTVCRTDDGGRTWTPSALRSTVTPKPCTPGT